MSRIRIGVAAICYGFAWISLLALMAILIVAERVEGDKVLGEGSDEFSGQAFPINFMRKPPR